MSEEQGDDIVARLVRVLAAVPTIEKNGTAPASQGGYKFRRVEDVTNALRPLFAAEGIIHTPRVLERTEAVRPTKSGGSLYVVDLHIEWTFRCVNGSSLIASMWGEGTDSGDKATQKAVTASLKSLLTPTFLISDEGDDAEAHDTPDATAPAVPLTPEQELAARKASWGDKKLPEGWETFEVMDEKHAAFQAGVNGMAEEERKQVGAFRAEQGIPWPMSTANMEEMLAEVKRITGLRAGAQEAGQAAADGPSGQDVTPGE